MYRLDNNERVREPLQRIHGVLESYRKVELCVVQQNVHDDVEAHAKLQERWIVDTSDRRHNEAVHVREERELMDAVVEGV